MGKFGPKKSKLSVLPENGHTEYGEDTDSYFDINFLNFSISQFLGKFGPKKSNYVYDFISSRLLTLLKFGALCTLY